VKVFANFKGFSLCINGAALGFREYAAKGAGLARAGCSLGAFHQKRRYLIARQGGYDRCEKVP
jgi:hypothetical protein